MPKPELTIVAWDGNLFCQACPPREKSCVYSRALTADVERLNQQPYEIWPSKATAPPDCVCEEHATAPFPATGASM
jgi:hypothetical protein